MHPAGSAWALKSHRPGAQHENKNSILPLHRLGAQNPPPRRWRKTCTRKFIFNQIETWLLGVFLGWKTLKNRGLWRKTGRQQEEGRLKTLSLQFLGSWHGFSSFLLNYFLFCYDLLETIARGRDWFWIDCIGFRFLILWYGFLGLIVHLLCLYAISYELLFMIGLGFLHDLGKLCMS